MKSCANVCLGLLAIWALTGVIALGHSQVPVALEMVALKALCSRHGVAADSLGKL